MRTGPRIAKMQPLLPPKSEVPLPRLLYRRENAPTPPVEAEPNRDAWTGLRQSRGSGDGVRLRDLVPDSPEELGRAPPRGGRRHDPPLAEARPVQEHAAQLPGMLDCECPGKVTEGDRVLSTEEGTPAIAPKPAAYVRLRNSFPPEFKAHPGESWKDFWRAVEFWLASEGVHLPPQARASRIMQQR